MHPYFSEHHRCFVLAPLLCLTRTLHTGLFVPLPRARPCCPTLTQEALQGMLFGKKLHSSGSHIRARPARRSRVLPNKKILPKTAEGVHASLAQPRQEPVWTGNRCSNKARNAGRRLGSLSSRKPLGAQPSLTPEIRNKQLSRSLKQSELPQWRIKITFKI